MGTKILLESDTNELEIIEFKLIEFDENGKKSSNHFGVNVAKVREIIRMPDITTVPNSQHAVVGMTKIRNKLVSIIDLARLLDKISDETATKRVIIMDFNEISVGIIVDNVARIHRVSWKKIEPPVNIPNMIIEEELVVGMIKMDDRILILLDFEKLIADIYPETAIKTINLSGEEKELHSMRSTKTVLVAEDSSFMRKRLVASIKGAGYKVLEASNGNRAHEILNNLNKMSLKEQKPLGYYINLVITDVEMPQMDGLYLTSLIKKDPNYKYLPVIIFSSMANEDNIRKWQRVAADEIIIKPNLPDLVKVCDKFIFKKESKIL